jgi:hypothetical protein
MSLSDKNFHLVFPPKLKKEANLSTTKAFSFDDLGDFIEERDRVKREAERRLETELRVDYSDFANHVFFDSAVSKFNLARSRILNNYPFDGNREEKDAFALTSSDYEEYVFDQWPRHVGYGQFDGADQYISASDHDNKLMIGTSSLCVSAWIKPVVTTENMIVQVSDDSVNMVIRSQEFDNAGWAKLTSGVTASQGTSPAGDSASDALAEDGTAASAHFITQDVTVVEGVRYVFSLYAQPVNRSWLRLYAHILGTGASSCDFDVTNGTVGTEVDCTGSVEDVGSSWYRCAMSFKAKKTDTCTLRIYINEADNDITFDGLDQHSFYIYHAQLEPGLIPRKRTVTTTAAISLVDGFKLYLSGAADPYLHFDVFSGSSEAVISASYIDFTASFNNVAGIYDDAANLVSLYISGSRVASGSATLNPIEHTSTEAFVGAGGHYSASIDFFSGSIDEVRVLHTASENYHAKNYSRPIDSEDFVKLYYKFNEGTTGTGSIDNIVVDYSKNAIHGKFLNYDVDVSRVSSSVMLKDPGDPILYSFHSGVVAFSSSQYISASLYDNNNNNYIFNMIPGNLLNEDENVDGLYASFTLAMARYFDELKLFIDQFDNLKVTNYDELNDTPDVFLPMLQRYFGWKVAEHYGEADPLSLFFGEGILQSGSLDTPLIDIKNQFWRRVLNNLPYLMKTKGKRHNIDAFLNVLGINKENIRLKEYGYLPGSSIQDTRIHKEKAVDLLGIGTGSYGTLSSSYVKATASISTALSDFTVETTAQFPYSSSSYSGSILTGAIWQFIDPEQVTGSFTLLWNKSTIDGTSGRFLLTSSDGQSYATSNEEVFDGDIVYIAAGLSSSLRPFIELRTIDNDEIDFSASYAGATALSGVFSGSKLDFVMGGNSGSFHAHKTQGFYGEYRVWDRVLSGSEMDDHALHFESVGIRNPNEDSNPLVGHWPLAENVLTNTNGELTGVLDLSRNDLGAAGAEFPASMNPYQKFLLEYNYLSPAIDLKWSENKIRIRNKTELTIDDVASDTNEVSLEFSLVEALNEDISKIFATMDILNNFIGEPVNKYRDEYSDLENLRATYFARLGDSVNFTTFFNLFKWFDKKLSDSIKQLLPARVNFIGGEQVIESHLLERPKYMYKYPVFRTPQDVSEMVLRGTYTDKLRDDDPLRRGYASASYALLSEVSDAIFATDGEKQRTLPEGSVAVMKGTAARSRDRIEFSASISSAFTSSALPESTVAVDGFCRKHFVSHFDDGINESTLSLRVDDATIVVTRKGSGDTSTDIKDPSSGVNFRNEKARKVLLERSRDNEDDHRG